MMKRKKIWILFIAAFVFLIYLVASEKRSSEAIKKEINVEKELISEGIATVTKKQPKIESSDIPLFVQAHQCRGDSKNYTIAERAWLKQLPVYLEELAQTYDRHSTLKALVGVVGKFRASSPFDTTNRKTILKSYQRVDHSSLKLELVSKLGDKALVEHRINWSIIPNEILEDVKQFRPEDINNLLRAGRYDAPYEVIFQRVIDLSRDFKGMRTSQVAPDNLFENISLLNKPDLLALYFRNGGLVKNVTSGSNALEKLIINVDKESLTDFSDMIKLLSQNGLSVRYRVKNNKHVVLGQFIETYTRFTQDDINNFKALGFPFTEAETEESVKENPRYLDLANAIIENRDQFLRSRLQIDSLESYAQCRELLEASDKNIVNQARVDEVNAIFKEFSDDLETLNKKLYELEPGLTDCAVKRKPFSTNTNTKPIRYEEINRIVKMYREMGVHHAIAEAIELELSNSEKRRLVSALAGRDTSYIPFLSDYGLLPDSFATADLMRSQPSIIEALSKQGYDFDLPSDTGRNLLEAAVASCNSNLVNWMVDQNFTYQYDNLRSDALAIAIREPCFNNTKKRIKLVSAVMRFNPTIKNYHRQRMAELRLKNYEAFTKLVNRYPQIGISNEVTPSGYFCNVISHSTELSSSYL